MKKKLLSVVLAVAVAFTFSFAMVGTASAAVAPYAPAEDDGIVQSITWAADYDSATVVVKEISTSDVYTLTFGQRATGYDKKTKTDCYIDQEDSQWSDAGIDYFTLKVDGPGTGNDEDLLNYWAPATASLSDYELVYDVRNLTAINEYDNPWSPEAEKVTPAGKYSAWCETKGTAAAAAYADKTVLIKGLMDGEGEPLITEDKKMFTVEYPEYSAFEYALAENGDKTNKVEKVKISPVAWTFGGPSAPDFKISTGVLELPVMLKVTDAKDMDQSFKYYTSVKFSNIAKDNAGNAYVDGDVTIDYDGQAHSPALVHPAKNTTVTYSYKVNDEGKYTEYSATAPEFKNVGMYEVTTKIVVDKSGEAIEVKDTLTIEPKDLRVYLIQKEFTKVYDGEGFEIPLDNYSYDGLIEGETLITGNEKTKADVGTYTILPTFDAAVKANYNVDIENLKAIGTITKAANDIHVNSKTLSIKRGSKKTLSASADFGDVTFQKTGGNSKVYVSKTGVVKVYKSAKKGKTYSVKVKASVKETKNYAGDSKDITLKVKVK